MYHLSIKILKPFSGVVTHVLLSCYCFSLLPLNFQINILFNSKTVGVPCGGSVMALEEGTGTEAMDAELLAKDRIARSQTKDQSHSDRYAVRSSRFS